MQNLNDSISLIENREDFLRFVGLLIADFKNNPAEWENRNIESYLEAMSSWIEDMEGFYINNGIDIPPNINWKFFASVLVAARIYE